MKIENIPETYPEIRDWADEYEIRAMFPTDTTHQLAETTTALLLYYTPNAIRGFAKKMIIGLVDERLRGAMMYPPQPSWVHSLINGFFAFRGVLLRNFFLPRYTPLSFTRKEKNEYGRYNLNWSDNEVFFPIEVVDD